MCVLACVLTFTASARVGHAKVPYLIPQHSSEIHRPSSSQTSFGPKPANKVGLLIKRHDTYQIHHSALKAEGDLALPTVVLHGMRVLYGCERVWLRINKIPV